MSRDEGPLPGDGNDRLIEFEFRPLSDIGDDGRQRLAAGLEDASWVEGPVLGADVIPILLTATASIAVLGDKVVDWICRLRLLRHGLAMDARVTPMAIEESEDVEPEHLRLKTNQGPS